MRAWALNLNHHEANDFLIPRLNKVKVKNVLEDSGLALRFCRPVILKMELQDVMVIDDNNLKRLLAMLC